MSIENLFVPRLHRLGNLLPGRTRNVLSTKLDPLTPFAHIFAVIFAGDSDQFRVCVLGKQRSVVVEVRRKDDETWLGLRL